MEIIVSSKIFRFGISSQFNPIIPYIGAGVEGKWVELTIWDWFFLALHPDLYIDNNSFVLSRWLIADEIDSLSRVLLISIMPQTDSAETISISLTPNLYNEAILLSTIIKSCWIKFSVPFIVSVVAIYPLQIL